jgi:hypothetical protein
LIWCSAGAAIQISQDYSSMVNFARCKVLGANVLRGKNQIPWDGKLEYDYQLWIDNDIVFNTESFWRLYQLGMEKRLHVVGMPLKMVTQLPLLTGLTKKTSKPTKV